MQTTRIYRDGRLRAAEEPLDELADLARGAADGERGPWGWIDLTIDERAALDALAERLDLHELAVEDALSKHERPKIQRYESSLLLAVTASSVPEESPVERAEDLDDDDAESDGGVDLARLTAFLLPRLIITVREPGFPMERVRQRLEENEDLARFGTGFVVWGLLDVVVDDHIDTLDRLDDTVEELSRELFENTVDMTSLQRRAFRFRRSVARMRHATIPLREVVTTLLRRDSPLIAKELQPYFTDVYDHALHSADWTESLRDQVSSVLETNIALQGNRMNEIMKKVTSWAAIIAVPTLITGFYGQNVSFPGFQTDWGFALSCALLLASGTSLWLVFKRQDWL